MQISDNQQIKKSKNKFSIDFIFEFEIVIPQRLRLK